MKSFAELLDDHIERAGVSDAELARRLGVSRQTIFRCREGLTKRPRSRQDVLELSSMLRLSVRERDALLLAAGFRPHTEEALDELVESHPIKTDAREGKPQTRIGSEKTKRLIFIGVVLLLLAVFLLLSPIGLDPFGLDGGEEHFAFEPASPGETLILVSEFANFAGEALGYNVAGRLSSALREVFDEAGLQEVRIARYEGVLVDADSAARVGETVAAALVIWGEYDSGRVIVHLVTPDLPADSGDVQRSWLVEDSASLSATINADLPQEVRWWALYTLGRLHLLQDEFDLAAAALKQALIEPLDDPSLQGAVHYYLGILHSIAPEPDYDRAIAHFSEALALQPGMVTALRNRGLTYLYRNAQGDRARAEADFEQALDLEPESSKSLTRLAYLRVLQSPDDLEPALALYEQALQLSPQEPEILNSLCWYGSLAGEPQTALEYCDQAVEADGSGFSNDSRGLTLALLGRYEEAADEFSNFLAILEENDPQSYEHYSTSRSAWIEALQAGGNPFDPVTLEALLTEG